MKRYLIRFLVKVARALRWTAFKSLGADRYVYDLIDRLCKKHILEQVKGINSRKMFECKTCGKIMRGKGK